MGVVATSSPTSSPVYSPSGAVRSVTATMVNVAGEWSFIVDSCAYARALAGTRVRVELPDTPDIRGHS